MKKQFKRMCMIAIAVVTVLGCNGQDERKFKEWDGEFNWEYDYDDGYPHVITYNIEIKPDNKGGFIGNMQYSYATRQYSEEKNYDIIGELAENTLIIKQIKGIVNSNGDESVIPKSELGTYRISKRNGSYYCKLKDCDGKTLERKLEFNLYDHKVKERVIAIYDEIAKEYKKAKAEGEIVPDMSSFNSTKYLSEGYKTLWDKAEEKCEDEGGYLGVDHWTYLQDVGEGVTGVNTEDISIKMISETRAKVDIIVCYIYGWMDERYGLKDERGHHMSLELVKERGNWYVDNFINDDGTDERKGMAEFLK